MFSLKSLARVKAEKTASIMCDKRAFPKCHRLLTNGFQRHAERLRAHKPFVDRVVLSFSEESGISLTVDVDDTDCFWYLVKRADTGSYVTIQEEHDEPDIRAALKALEGQKE